MPPVGVLSRRQGAVVEGPDQARRRLAPVAAGVDLVEQALGVVVAHGQADGLERVLEHAGGYRAVLSSLLEQQREAVLVLRGRLDQAPRRHASAQRPFRVLGAPRVVVVRKVAAVEAVRRVVARRVVEPQHVGSLKVDGGALALHLAVFAQAAHFFHGRVVVVDDVDVGAAGAEVGGRAFFSWMRRVRRRVRWRGALPAPPLLVRGDAFLGFGADGHVGGLEHGR